jgi:hypothetical protein
MPEFEKLLARHGEGWIQEIIERLERYEGMRLRTGTPLEERWAALMQPTASQPLAA